MQREFVSQDGAHGLFINARLPVCKIFTDGFGRKRQSGVRAVPEALPLVSSLISSLVTNIRCAQRLCESDPTRLNGLQTRQQRPRIHGKSLG